MRASFYGLVSCVASAAVLGSSGVAAAQGAPTGSVGGNIPSVPPATETPTDSGMGDIVVTARRVSEDAQTVPVPVSAFNADALRASSISQPQDLQPSVAGIFLGGLGAPTNANYAIRGVTKPVEIGRASVRERVCP